jgi:hypothetical protein
VRGHVVLLIFSEKRPSHLIFYSAKFLRPAVGQVLEFTELDTQGLLDENDASRPVGASNAWCANVQRTVVAGFDALGGCIWDTVRHGPRCDIDIGVGVGVGGGE